MPVNGAGGAPPLRQVPAGGPVPTRSAASGPRGDGRGRPGPALTSPHPDPPGALLTQSPARPLPGAGGKCEPPPCAANANTAPQTLCQRGGRGAPLRAGPRLSRFLRCPGARSRFVHPRLYRRYRAPAAVPFCFSRAQSDARRLHLRSCPSIVPSVHRSVHSPASPPPSSNPAVTCPSVCPSVRPQPHRRTHPVASDPSRGFGTRSGFPQKRRLLRGEIRQKSPPLRCHRNPPTRNRPPTAPPPSGAPVAQPPQPPPPALLPHPARGPTAAPPLPTGGKRFPSSLPQPHHPPPHSRSPSGSSRNPAPPSRAPRPQPPPRTAPPLFLNRYVISVPRVLAPPHRSLPKPRRRGPRSPRSTGNGWGPRSRQAPSVPGRRRGRKDRAVISARPGRLQRALPVPGAQRSPRVTAPGRPPGGGGRGGGWRRNAAGRGAF